MGLNDSKILGFLTKEGYPLTIKILKRLRLALGMRRCFHPTEFAVHNEIMRQAIQSQLENGQTTLYGRQYTYQILRQCGIPAVRDRMFNILYEVDPIGIANRRLHITNMPRGGYFVPGPNYVWSIDGYHKLSMYGIEIYAGVDAYSRFDTIWLYPWLIPLLYGSIQL
ncbi:hypothetical protein B9Z19DRAFT_1063777 [Tuber borchii]|uniref:Uncharacterized protein n=1 Tax=Tuber borchii TaxID=42251 RepID=A0A2T6ZX23_TUBBO|nr:hypothetical protein B9Z19DRAFT_1063777 [Tuber borchii]